MSGTVIITSDGVMRPLGEGIWISEGAHDAPRTVERVLVALRDEDEGPEGLSGFIAAAHAAREVDDG